MSTNVVFIQSTYRCPQDDVDLVINNALLYNKPDSAVYRAASRLKKSAPPLYTVLDNERMSVPGVLSNGVNHLSPIRDICTETVSHSNGPSVSGGVMDVSKGIMDVNEGAMDIDEALKTDLTIGDLEPPLVVLELLTCISAIKPDLPVDLRTEPLQSLLSYELAVPKPLPTPPPPPPPKSNRKRDRRAEYERAKAKKAAAAAEAMATAAEALTLLNGGYHHEYLARTHPSIDQSQIVDAEVSLQSPPLQTASPAPDPSLHPALSPPPSALSLSSSSASAFPDISEVSSSSSSPLPQPFARAIVYGSQGFINTSFEDHSAAISASPFIIETPGDAQNSVEMDSISPKPGRPPRRKRSSLSLLGRTELPPVVLDVDNRDSFKMFDGGWILPPDQRRRGRMPVDRSLQLPPRKRARTGTFSFSWYP